MQAEYYSDKSIAVFGETKPWAANFKALGGKFNYNLRGRQGWILPRKSEAEIVQFVANANAGLIQPAAETPAYTIQPALVPFGVAQPALTPQAAFNRLQAQPVAFPTAFSQATLPLAQPIQPTIMMAPRPATPTGPRPVTALLAQPVTLNYPNLFTAADGMQYQVVIYTAVKPSLGQRVTLTVGDAILEYTVSTVKNNAPFDDILVTQILPTDAPAEQEAAQSRAILMNGEWKIHCMQDEHRLTFHPLE